LSTCTYGSGVLAASVSEVELSGMTPGSYATPRTARTDARPLARGPEAP
jgi:hypothetical protein